MQLTEEQRIRTLYPDLFPVQDLRADYEPGTPPEIWKEGYAIRSAIADAASFSTVMIGPGVATGVTTIPLTQIVPECGNNQRTKVSICNPDGTIWISDSADPLQMNSNNAFRYPHRGTQLVQGSLFIYTGSAPLYAVPFTNNQFMPVYVSIEHMRSL